MCNKKAEETRRVAMGRDVKLQDNLVTTSTKYIL